MRWSQHAHVGSRGHDRSVRPKRHRWTQQLSSGHRRHQCDATRRRHSHRHWHGHGNGHRHRADLRESRHHAGRRRSRSCIYCRAGSSRLLLLVMLLLQLLLMFADLKP